MLKFFPEIMRFTEIYDASREAKNDNIKRRMRFACCIPKFTKTNTEYVILIAFPLQNCFRETPQCSVTRTLPHTIVLLSMTSCTSSTFK
jgi:hypothetical protein